MLKIGSSGATNHQESEQLTSNSQLNNNNMELVDLLPFNLEKFNTGNFELVTANDRPVEIGVVNDEKRAAILGWFDGFSGSWDINGNYLITKGLDKFNLKLKPKAQTVYITVTRNPEGKINVYGSIEGEPKVQSKSTLLKRLTVDVL